MGRRYMYYHWNQFDFLVIILGIADVVLINIFEADDPSYAIVNSLRVFRFMRVLRLFRLLKVSKYLSMFCTVVLCSSNFIFFLVSNM